MRDTFVNLILYIFSLISNNIFACDLAILRLINLEAMISSVHCYVFSFQWGKGQIWYKLNAYELSGS